MAWLIILLLLAAVGGLGTWALRSQIRGHWRMRRQLAAANRLLAQIRDHSSAADQVNDPLGGLITNLIDNHFNKEIHQ